MSGMYQDKVCTAISCSRLATLELILEVGSKDKGDMRRDPDHKPYSFLSRVGYCDYDFGFFYRKLQENYDVVDILVVPGVDDA